MPARARGGHETALYKTGSTPRPPSLPSRHLTEATGHLQGGARSGLATRGVRAPDQAQDPVCLWTLLAGVRLMWGPETELGEMPHRKCGCCCSRYTGRTGQRSHQEASSRTLRPPTCLALSRGRGRGGARQEVGSKPQEPHAGCFPGS